METLVSNLSQKWVKALKNSVNTEIKTIGNREVLYIPINKKIALLPNGNSSEIDFNLVDLDNKVGDFVISETYKKIGLKRVRNYDVTNIKAVVSKFTELVENITALYPIKLKQEKALEKKNLKAGMLKLDGDKFFSLFGDGFFSKVTIKSEVIIEDGKYIMRTFNSFVTNTFNLRDSHKFKELLLLNKIYTSEKFVNDFLEDDLGYLRALAQEVKEDIVKVVIYGDGFLKRDFYFEFSDYKVSRIAGEIYINKENISINGLCKLLAEEFDIYDLKLIREEILECYKTNLTM